MEPTCGARAPRGQRCVLPSGHNMGAADVPANHQGPPATRCFKADFDMGRPCQVALDALHAEALVADPDAVCPLARKVSADPSAHGVYLTMAEAQDMLDRLQDADWIIARELLA